ncbi:AAA family ATPase [Mycobacterium yunnanensis]|uniref:AAA family ATPase n=1 Tax=Mycobacterium yunnanensis TaxID=368477 RepID=A0A9X2Z6R2_9MYCO|nr:AAA family ATPase [Mycobacterium yunnanensis]
MGRQSETHAVEEFLVADRTAPAGLLVEGAPGLGKTTLWLAGVDTARERGYRVLAARPAEAESALAYSALADLLNGVDASVRSELPEAQRVALDHVQLRSAAGGAPTDPRAVAAALLAVVTRLTAEAPVLLAMDDLQWFDTSSARAVEFLTRRLVGRVAVLATTRDDSHSVRATSWLQLPSPADLRRITLSAMSIGQLQAIIADRLGTSFPRPVMVDVHEVSGGNPFFALELARSLQSHGGRTTSLPASLKELVRARIGGLDSDVRAALLVVACLAAPTVDVVARAAGAAEDDLLLVLREVEEAGIVEVNGSRLRFAHPLLARGVYTEATAARRRAVHAQLAEVVDDPEARARHLALSATSATPAILHSLDVAAELASMRGAPATAAELLDLARELGDDAPGRRLRCASLHVQAGDPGRARNLLGQVIAHFPPGDLRANAFMLLAVIELFDDSFAEGVGVLVRGLAEVGQNDELSAQMLTTLAFALLNVGRAADALDQVEAAVETARRCTIPALLGQALGMRAMIRFVQGAGFDQSDMRRALELEAKATKIPIAFRATMQNALLSAWTGQLGAARDVLMSIRRSCVDRGAEGELVFVSFHACFVAIWLGDLAEAQRVAADTVERARQLGGNVSLFVALTTRAATRTYIGDESGARADLVEASAATARSGFSAMGEWPLTVLGLLEVSTGNHQAAVDVLAPLIAKVVGAPEATEIIGGSFLPDAVEALVGLGRLDEAQRLVDVVERNGRRLDRAWMLAVGGRTRGMVLAARGDLAGAQRAVDGALIAHARLPMPFERARTQLTLGVIHLRRGQASAATSSLAEAVTLFEQLGTPLWAARARAELARAGNGTSTPELTASEQKVARLTASGMTNGEVATALFISPKTVEFHLARIYRKLGIRSRAELGRLVRDPN